MEDNSTMPFGKYKGLKMANVPAWYLLSLYDNNRCYGGLKEYINDNYDLLVDERDKTNQKAHKQ